MKHRIVAMCLLAHSADAFIPASGHQGSSTSLSMKVDHEEPVSRRGALGAALKGATVGALPFLFQVNNARALDMDAFMNAEVG